MSNEILVSGKRIARQTKKDEDSANEREKGKEKQKDEMERFESMTSSELTALVQTATAFRRPGDVARAANWFRRKADTLRKLEPSKLACGRKLSTVLNLTQ